MNGTCYSVMRRSVCFDGRIDHYWAKIFAVKAANGTERYPLLFRLRRSSHCPTAMQIVNGDSVKINAFLQLSISSVNRMRHMKTYLQRHGGDATKVPLTLDLIRSVKQSGTKYEERISAEETKKRKASVQKDPEQPKSGKDLGSTSGSKQGTA